MQHRQAGFHAMAILAIVALIAVLGLVGWRIYQVQLQPTLKTNPITPASTTKRVVALGDIVCDPSDPHRAQQQTDYCQDERVYNLVASLKPDAVLALGDLQYEDGSLTKFQTNFDPTWGKLKSIMYPTPGNHEYSTPDAAGYYEYFRGGPADVSQGYYSFQLGSWQIVSLNSNCSNIGGCQPDSAQLMWLSQTLQQNRTPCALAFWHHPRFTSGKYNADTTSKSTTQTMWQSLFTYKADLVLNGHDHLYERFAPQDPTGSSIAQGIRQFTVGTGGKSHYAATAATSNSEKIVDDQYGVLVLDLGASTYNWQFINLDRRTLDSGHQHCNNLINSLGIQ